MKCCIMGDVVPSCGIKSYIFKYVLIGILLLWNKKTWLEKFEITKNGIISGYTPELNCCIMGNVGKRFKVKEKKNEILSVYLF